MFVAACSEDAQSYTWINGSLPACSYSFSSDVVQDSAAVQILLEICLPIEEEKSLSGGSGRLLKSIPGSALSSPRKKQPEEEEEGEKEEDSLLCNLREVQCLICCLLHQMFIADPNIAKLVHFQVCAVYSCCFFNKERRGNKVNSWVIGWSLGGIRAAFLLMLSRSWSGQCLGLETA